MIATGSVAGIRHSTFHRSWVHGFSGGKRLVDVGLAPALLPTCTRTALVTISGVIRCMHRGRLLTVSTQTFAGLSFSSPSSRGTLRERQQPPVAQQGSWPMV